MTLGPGDTIGEGDCSLLLDLLPAGLSAFVFDKLKEEVQWDKMSHKGGEVPRLVAVEGELNADGSFPIYRHPADLSPPLHTWSPTVSLIRDYVEKALRHPVNHVLIQLYRSGTDYISEHSDKTIDVVRGSTIANVSFGAQRVMRLRTKKDASSLDEDTGLAARTKQRIPLPHNSLFAMGLETNRKWLHGITQDKRLPVLKSSVELSYGGARISLTFRRIGTFLTADEKFIWGQGAKGKTRTEAGAAVNGTEEAENLLRAFGAENQQSEFEWEAVYGEGFDVLHFSSISSAGEGE